MEHYIMVSSNTEYWDLPKYTFASIPISRIKLTPKEQEQFSINKPVIFIRKEKNGTAGKAWLGNISNLNKVTLKRKTVRVRWSFFVHLNSEITCPKALIKRAEGLYLKDIKAAPEILASIQGSNTQKK